MLLHVCFGFIWAFSRLIQFIFSLSTPSQFLFYAFRDKCTHHVFWRGVSFIGLHDVFDFHKIDIRSFCRKECFHKKMGKSLFFMLTKVILLKALFEEEIRRHSERKCRGLWRVSHNYLYGWCWGWSIIYHFY